MRKRGQRSKGHHNRAEICEARGDDRTSYRVCEESRVAKAKSGAVNSMARYVGDVLYRFIAWVYIIRYETIETMMVSFRRWFIYLWVMFLLQYSFKATYRLPFRTQEIKQHASYVLSSDFDYIIFIYRLK